MFIVLYFVNVPLCQCVPIGAVRGAGARNARGGTPTSGRHFWFEIIIKTMNASQVNHTVSGAEPGICIFINRGSKTGVRGTIEWVDQ